MLVLLQIELLYLLGHLRLLVLLLKGFQVIVQLNLFPNGQCLHKCVELGAVAQRLSDPIQVVTNLQATEVTIPRCGCNLAG